MDGAASSGSSSSSGSSDESVEIRKHHPIHPRPMPMAMPMSSSAKHGRLFDNLVVLDNLPEAEVGAGGTTVAVGSVMGGDVDDDCDELFLLPESVLAMDSESFREDVRSVAPSLLTASAAMAAAASASSPHNSLDSTDSARSLRGAAAACQDQEQQHHSSSTDGLLRMARASEGCKTLWLCELLTLLSFFPFSLGRNLGMWECEVM